MQRSGWKLPYISPIFFSKMFFNSKRFFTFERHCTILTHFCGKTFRIYSGNAWKTVLIQRLMVGKKLGDFSITKIFGNAIALSMAIKQKRKKEDKKKKKKKK